MRSVISPATPVSTTPGPPTSTPKPSPGNATTSTPSASWPAPGSTSSGAAGRTTPSTTRPTTARCKGSSIKINNRWQLDTGQLIDPALHNVDVGVDANAVKLRSGPVEDIYL